MATFLRWPNYNPIWLLVAIWALAGCAASPPSVAGVRSETPLATTPTVMGEATTAVPSRGEVVAATPAASMPVLVETQAAPVADADAAQPSPTHTPDEPATSEAATSKAFDKVIYLPLAYTSAPPPTPTLTATVSPTPEPTATETASPTAEPPTQEPPSPTAPPSSTVPPAPPPAPAAPPTNAPPSDPSRPSPTRVPTQAVAGAEASAPTMHLRTDLPAMSLQDWPRPANDNGRCMHFVRNQYFSEDDLHVNVQRLQQLGARWTLVVYADENIIKMAAPVFAEAGIVPVWRKMLRAHQPYYDWARDVELVKSYGLPPYFQIYNEPSLLEEWELSDSGPDVSRFTSNLIQASQDVYNAGGYVGWQFVNQEWLGHAIDEVQRRGGQRLFERFFYIPHPYGMNFPPDYTADGRGVLSYRYYADQLRQRLGFTPMMIAGEGGWKINNTESPNYPPLSDASHRDYHVELFNWFRTGVLSDGQPLPDELFAYCVWLVADRGDDNAWWDSFAGNRQGTIDAVSAMPAFQRRFSWER